jgi:ribosome-associated toxin RatA of RatAB toxin-antitoxin module
MAELGGEERVEILAPLERCFALAADIEGAPRWQGGMHDNQVVERDAEGRASVVRTTVDIKVKTVAVTLRISYEAPHRVLWERISGDLRSLRGGWTFEELEPARTLAIYEMRSDPGMILGRLAAPIAGVVRQQLVGVPPAGLKREAEA